jgi:hypothetical protein
MNNIEKGLRGTWIGHATGVWSVRRTAFGKESSKAWIAMRNDDPQIVLYARTLKDLDKKLAAWNEQHGRTYKPRTLPPINAQEETERYIRSRRYTNPGTKMRLLYLPANAAWAFHFGKGTDSRPISMGNYGTFFQSRKEAVAAARHQGLTVSRGGFISSAPAPRAKNPSFGNDGTGRGGLQVGDPTAAHELVLYADNSSELYNQKQSIIKNLLRKMKAGKYDAVKAIKLWQYWIDNAARGYKKEFGGNFNASTRRFAASEVALREDAKMRHGEYASMDIKIHRSKNPSGIYVIGIRAIKAGKTTPMLYFDGQNFEKRKTPKKFSSYESASKTAHALASTYRRQLAKYRVYVVTTG